mgnify:CR=1 FL=1
MADPPNPFASGGAKPLWKSVKKLTHLVAMTGGSLQNVRVKRISDLPKALGKSSGSSVKTTVDNAEELAKLKKYEQGDEAM